MSTTLEMQVNKTQAGLYTVTHGYLNAPENIRKAVFADNGLGIISPTQQVFLRLQCFTRTKEGIGTFDRFSMTNAEVFYDTTNSQIVIVPDAAISKIVGISNLVDAYIGVKLNVIPKGKKDAVYGLVGKMLRNGTAFTAKDGKTNVNTSELGRNELIYKLFSDDVLKIKAQEYGDWLGCQIGKYQGRKIISLSFDSMDYAKSQKGPYWTKLRLLGRYHGFGVEGYSGGPYGKRGAFGVRFEKAA